jgi:ribosomal small subunit protein bTHX
MAMPTSPITGTETGVAQKARAVTIPTAARGARIQSNRSGTDMGKGDKKTRKGKTYAGSHGNVRPHSPKSKAAVKTTVARKAAPRVAKAAPAKAAPAKKAAVKKAAAKKAAPKKAAS